MTRVQLTGRFELRALERRARPGGRNPVSAAVVLAIHEAGSFVSMIAVPTESWPAFQAAVAELRPSAPDEPSSTTRDPS